MNETISPICVWWYVLYQTLKTVYQLRVTIQFIYEKRSDDSLISSVYGLRVNGRQFESLQSTWAFGEGKNRD